MDIPCERHKVEVAVNGQPAWYMPMQSCCVECLREKLEDEK